MKRVLRPLLSKYLNTFIILFCTAVFFFFLIDLGENVLDSGDGILHYQMSKYSWVYPYLFLNHWGKPLFTFLSSPFAQFGFKGMVVFNILLFVVSSFFLIKITKLFKEKNGWLVVLLCFAAPTYFASVLSGMTEVLMSTTLILSLYYYLKESFIIGTLILSFSLLARPESNIIIPFFILYLLYKKQFKALPFVFVGFIVFSFAGSFFYDNFFWIITERPYSSKGTYGSGSFFHFIGGYNQILGFIGTALFVLGTSLLFVKKQYEQKRNAIFILILFPAVSVLLVHSLVWWKGLQGSAGYYRVLSTVIPLFALISFFGLNRLHLCLKKSVNIISKQLFLLFTSVLILLGGLISSQIDNRLRPEQEVLNKAANWYKQYGANKRIYYLPPYFSYRADIDPFSLDGTRDNMKYFGDKNKPSNNMKDGEFLLWDGEFSVIEGGISLEDCVNDEDLVSINTFYPKEHIYIYGKLYSARIFKKININNEIKSQTVNRLNKQWVLTSKNLQVVENTDEFIGLFHADNKTSQKEIILQYDFSCKIKLPAEYENKKLKLVYKWETLGEGVFYDSKDVEIKEGGEFDFEFISNSSCYHNSEFSMYFWNINRVPITLSELDFSVKSF